MERLAMCRICLRENVELKCIANTKLQEVYQKLTCLPLKTEDHKPLTACYMCIALLRKAYKLMIDCLEAEQWYTNISMGMNCMKHDVCSNLSVASIPPIEIGCSVILCDRGKKKKIDNNHRSTEATNSIEVDNITNSQSSDSPIDWNERKFRIDEESDSENSERDGVNWNENKLNDEGIIYEYSENLYPFHVGVKVEEHLDRGEVPDRSIIINGGLGTFIVSEDEDKMARPDTPKIHTKNKIKNKQTKKKCVQNNRFSEKHEQFECDQCFKVFPSKPCLKHHSFVHNESDIRACKLCGKTFTRPQSYHRHMRAHSASFQCVQCQKEFPERYQLKRHMARHGVERSEFICDHCNMSYSTKYRLRRHIINKHSSSAPVQCQVCDKPLANMTLLKQHLLIHTMKKQFQCDKCAQTFKRKHTLMVHLQTHERVRLKPFVCTVCGRAFVDNATLKKHVLRLCGELKQKCELCDETFIQLKHLLQHKREVHSVGVYKCDVCQLHLSSKHSFKRHKRVHTGERPYQCNTCYQSFTVGHTLKEHLRTHTGEKPYKCELCPKAFAQKTPLTTHMRTHNKNKK